MSNRLRDQISPYLLQHADNPVDWYPWGPEALERARREDKPIFLSIGYAACHWCHVMAHESFEDAHTADIMNQHFVNIKVDREERPDLDSLYMDAVVALTGQGGWPMSVFLTPQAEPFYGGTYFPPSRRFNMPSFQEVLLGIASAWEQNRQRLLEGGRQLAQQLGATISLDSQPDELRPEAFDRAAQALFKIYDWRHGGWGAAPKFPQPMTVEFLLRRHARHADRLALDMALHALRAMAAGGIFDHLAGGFARYSVDPRWLVPHFEKMLYDNAQLALAYLRAWQATGATDLLHTADRTLDFMLTELRHGSGGFYSSLDADSEGEEGKYYLWSAEEIASVLGEAEPVELFKVAYGVTEAGHFDGRNVLHRAIAAPQLAQQGGIPQEQVEASLAESRRRLLRARADREPPGLDDKALTAWNGLALLAFAQAARATGRADRLEVAQGLADFLLTQLVRDGRLCRSWRQGQARYTAYLEDHAALGLGLLALYQADFDQRWYQAGLSQAEEILQAFADPRGGFFDTRHDHERLIARPKSVQDSPTPSGNTLACMLLLQLATLTGDHRFSDPAERAIGGMQETAARHPSAFAGWLCAMDFAVGPRLQLAIAGDPAGRGFAELAAVANSGYLPNLLLAGGQPDDAGLPPLMADRPMQDGHPTAYLCQGFTCKLPTAQPQELQRQLAAALRG